MTLTIPEWVLIYFVCYLTITVILEFKKERLTKKKLQLEKEKLQHEKDIHQYGKSIAAAKRISNSPKHSRR